MLFDPGKPVTMSLEMFNETWPYIDSVYTQLRGEELQASGHYAFRNECRLRKSKKSSAAKDFPDKVIKRRHGSIKIKAFVKYELRSHVQWMVPQSLLNE